MNCHASSLSKLLLNPRKFYWFYWHLWFFSSDYYRNFCAQLSPRHGSGMACEQLPCQVFSPCSELYGGSWATSLAGPSASEGLETWDPIHKTLGDDPSKNQASNSHPFGDVSLTVRVLRSLVYVCQMSSPCIWSTFNTSSQTNSDVISKHVSDSIKSKHIISHHIVSYHISISYPILILNTSILHRFMTYAWKSESYAPPKLTPR